MSFLPLTIKIGGVLDFNLVELALSEANLAYDDPGLRNEDIVGLQE